MGVKICRAALAAALMLLAACRGAPAPLPPALSGAGGADPPAQSVPAPPQEEPPAQEESLPENPPAEDPQSRQPVPAPPASEEPENTTVYILMYHDFVQGDGQGLNNWTLTQDRFREDLQWLADHGYAAVLPSQLAAGEPLPPRAVMLTFDDGYESNYTLAYPLLQEYGGKAVISVIVQYVDGQTPGFLTWDMCREMVQSGLVELGSHTYACHDGSERGIKRLRGESREAYEARVLPDLQASIDLIQANTGAAPLLFAYPNGVKEAWAADFIAEHFALTVTTRHGPAGVDGGLYSLPRHNVSMGTPLSRFLPE